MKIVVCDIDGTVANVDHRRQFVATRPKNWAAWNAGMGRDTVYEDIVAILDLFADADFTVILCSGRGEESREVTEQWLSDNDIPYQQLYMSNSQSESTNCRMRAGRRDRERLGTRHPLHCDTA